MHKVFLERLSKLSLNLYTTKNGYCLPTPQGKQFWKQVADISIVPLKSAPLLTLPYLPCIVHVLHYIFSSVGCMGRD